MDKIVYKELSYHITGLCFRAQKELGRFCRERQYTDRLEELLKVEKVRYQREFEIRKLNSDSTKGNRVDFLIEDQMLLDAKAKPFITKEDYLQMQRYLRGANLKLGLIVNFRDTYLKPKRVLNSRHSHSYSHFSHRSRGFTLLEMIIALGIFAVIAVIATGSLVSILDANRKAQAEKSVANNLHFAFENMSRNLRMGHSYHCGSAGVITEPLDCPNTSDSFISFVSAEGDIVAYRQGEETRADGTVVKMIKRAVRHPGDSGPLVFVPLTAPEISVEQLQFFVGGAPSSDKKQPRVLILANGVMKARGNIESRFNIETLVSQRLLDVKQ